MGIFNRNADEAPEPATEQVIIEVTDPVTGEVIRVAGSSEDDAQSKADAVLAERYPES